MLMARLTQAQDIAPTQPQGPQEWQPFRQRRNWRIAGWEELVRRRTGLTCEYARRPCPSATERSASTRSQHPEEENRPLVRAETGKSPPDPLVAQARQGFLLRIARAQGGQRAGDPGGIGWILLAPREPAAFVCQAPVGDGEYPRPKATLVPLEGPQAPYYRNEHL